MSGSTGGIGPGESVRGGLLGSTSVTDTGTTGTNADQPSVRTGVPGEVAAELVIGGTLASPIDNNPQYDPGQLQSMLDAIQSTVGGLALTIRQGIDDKLQPIVDTVTALKGKLEGTVSLPVEKIVDVADRLRSKIEQAVNTKVAGIYNRMAGVGIPFPSREDVQYFLASGDPLGAIGIAPPLTGASGNFGGLETPPLPSYGGGALPGTTIAPPATIPYPSQQPGNPNAPPPPPLGLPAVPPPLPVGLPPQPVSPVAGPIWPFGPPPTVIPLPTGGPPGGPIASCPPCGPGGGEGGGPAEGPPGGPGGPPGGGGGPPPAPPNPCPPGFHPADQPSPTPAPATTPPPPTQLPPGIRVVQPAPPQPGFEPGTGGGEGIGQPCEPQITFGIQNGYTTPRWNPDGSFNYGFPWLSPATNPPGITVNTVCFDQCYLASGGVKGQPYCVQVPKGYVLCVSQAGIVTYKMQCGPDDTPLPIISVNGIPVAQPAPGGKCGGPEVCVPDEPPPEQCVPVQKPGCGPDAGKAIPPLGGGAGGALGGDALAQICKDLQGILLDPNTPPGSLRDYLGMNMPGGDSGTIGNAICRAIIGVDQAIIPNLINRAIDWLQGLMTKSADIGDCNKAELLAVQVVRATLGLFHGWFGIVPEQALTVLNQRANTVCHVDLPNQAETNSAWLNNQITDDVWECFTKAAGNRVDPAKAVRDGERERANVEQIFRLYRRKIVDDDTKNKLLRGRGVTDKDDQERLWKLTEELPAIQDIITFMRRDVFNEDLVAQSKADEGFDQNYDGRAKDLGYAQGFTDDIARYFWRAHWQIPSYTMLREMLFRLRPDVVGDELGMDTTKVKKALYADGFAPGYLDRMIEIAYLPINRTDFTSMYFNSVIDDDQLKGKYLNVGYKPEDADLMVAHLQTLKRIRNLKAAGFPSLGQLSDLYAKCRIDDVTLEDGIQKWTTNDEQVEDAMEAANIRRRVWILNQEITTIQKSFRFGLMSDADAQTALLDAGVDPQCVPGFVKRFKRQRSKQLKYAPAATLCKWRGQGIIGDEEYLLALSRLGYSSDDAIRMVESCDISISEKAAKAAAAQAKKDASAAAKAAKASKGKATSNP